MRKSILVTILTVLTSLTAASPALASTATAHPLRLPPVIRGTAPALHPEGFAWDPTRGAFLVGSVKHGTVSVVRPDGSIRTLVSDPHLDSTFGVHVDVRRGRFLVAYADLGLGDRTGGASGIGIFDLRTGRTLRLIDFGRLVNDFALDPDGNAYVTDPGGDTLYTVDTRGRFSVLVTDPRFAGTGFALNGIVWHRGGYLIVVKYDTGKLFRVPVRHPERFTEVTLDRPLVGGDGITLRPDGALVVSTNKLASSGEDAEQVLRSPNGWRTAHQVQRIAPWPDPAPTAVTVTPSGTYALSGRLDILGSGGTSDEFILRKLPLSAL